MKPKRFYTWLMICGLFFALIMAGGCGGGNGSMPVNNDGDTEKTSDPSDSLQAMSIPKDKEIELTVLLEDVFTLIEELSADGSIEKINQRGLYTLTISRDFDKDTAIFSGNGQLSFSSNDLRPKYEAGAVMCIISPTEEAINALLEELGETPNFTLTNASDDPQLYAVARDKDSSGRSHMFTYQIPSRKSFKYTQGEITILSSDISEDISTDIDGYMSGKSEDIPYVPTGTTEADIELMDKRFQIQRLGDFFRWCADGIDSKLAEIEANSAAVNATFRAALDNAQLTSLSSAYNPVKNFSYEKTFVPFGDDNGGGYNRTITRNTTGRYTVYSCHSFSTGSDFYLVQAKLESTPGYGETVKQNDYTDGSPAFWTHYHYGFTDYLINSAYIEGADANNTNVAIIKTIPSDSIPKTYNRSQSMSWNLGGSVGGSYVQTPGFGANLGLTGGVSHNETVNYTTQNWTIENETSISVPKFRASFIREENDGDPHESGNGVKGLDEWQDIKVDEATTRRIDYTVEWIWEVKKDFWQNRDKVKIIANPIIGERFAHGWGWYRKDKFFSYEEHGSKNNGKATTIESSLPQDLGVPAPAHIYVSKSAFEVASAGANDETFELLCNTDWKVESNSDWCVLQFATPVEDTVKGTNTIIGKDTGSSNKKIHFSIEPFKTLTGENNIPREATITITEILPGNKTGQTVKISVAQLPPDAHISVSSTDLSAEYSSDPDGTLSTITMSFNLKATGKWTVSSDSDWCVIDPSCTSGNTTGSGGKAITFKVTQGTIRDDITSKATIKVTDDLGNYINIYVSRAHLYTYIPYYNPKRRYY